MKSHCIQNGKLCETYLWRIENLSKLDSKKFYSDTFFLNGYPWRLFILPNKNYLSIYLDVWNPARLKRWHRNASFELALLNQVNASKTIVKETQHVFRPSQHVGGFHNFIRWDELCDPSEGFIVYDSCLVNVRMISVLTSEVVPTVFTPTIASVFPSVLENPLPKETSFVDFKGLGKMEKAFVPLLEEVCSWHPSLVDSQRKKNRTRMFTEWAFTALGRVLHFLKTKKVKDMNEDACNHLQILWEELEIVGFDLSWLEPHFRSAMGMKTYFERAANVKRLKENVDALEKDLQIAISNLAEAENDFVERDLDAELGYGAP